MKHPQTKFHTHTTATPKLLGKKSQNFSLGQVTCNAVFSLHRYFIETTTTVIDILQQV